MGREGFEPPKYEVRQIYSLMPLAARPPTRSTLLLETRPLEEDLFPSDLFFGRAGGGNRTHNLRFTKPVHYRCATPARRLVERITIGVEGIARKVNFSGVFGSDSTA